MLPLFVAQSIGHYPLLILDDTKIENKEKIKKIILNLISINENISSLRRREEKKSNQLVILRLSDFPGINENMFEGMADFLSEAFTDWAQKGADNGTLLFPEEISKIINQEGEIEFYGVNVFWNDETVH